jgi:uncharacterized glyoxalase superfamily protein PhnB
MSCGGDTPMHSNSLTPMQISEPQRSFLNFRIDSSYYGTVADLGDHSYFAYLTVDDVDALHAEFVGRGAIILHAASDKPWGQREMAVATPDGHRMMFAQPDRDH